MAADGKYDMRAANLHFYTIETLNWVVVEPAALTASAMNEIVGAARTKKEAEELAHTIYASKKWRRRAFVTKRSDLLMAPAKRKDNK